MVTKKLPLERRPVAPRRKEFAPPATITLPSMLASGSDVAFRETLYLMFSAFSSLQGFRDSFGEAIGLTAPQFIVLIGTAYRQGSEGVSVRALADHTLMAATHVTTEVGRLIGKGLLTKSANPRDGRSVLIRLSPAGEAAVRAVNPLLRKVNDLLFQDVPREDFAVVAKFLRTFALNTEYAMAAVRRAEQERAATR
jgi:DNA-binding MarR family transcriptional regulator